MIRSLFSAVSALENLQNGMDVIGNNISNVDTNGFKAQETSFQDTLYQTMRSATLPPAAAAGNGGLNPSQVGTGMTLAEITNDMSQGTLQNTGRTLDLAIQGNGFFTVTNVPPTGAYVANSGNTFFKRDGVFHIDASGNLVDENGYYALDTNGKQIVIKTTANSNIATLNIGQDGSISGTDTTGAALTFADAGCNQIGLATFNNQDGLQRMGQNLFAWTVDSGNPGAAGALGTFAMTLSAPNQGGVGSISSGYLESSNVNLANEFANLITTERSYEANTKMITTSDQMLLDLMNLKAGA